MGLSVIDKTTGRTGLLGDFAPLAELLKGRAAVAPAIIALGLAASLAEGLGIGLVVVFLYAAMGQTGEVAGSNLILGKGVEIFERLGGSPALLAVAVFVLMLARVVLNFGHTLLTSHLSNDLSRRVRDRVHHQYLRISYGEISQRDYGELVVMLATESFMVAEACLSIAQIAINVCAAVVFTAMLLNLSWELTLIAAAGSAIVAAILRLLTGPARRLGARTSQAHEALAGHMVHTLQGMRTLRAFGQEEARQASFERASADTYRVALQTHRLRALIPPIGELCHIALLGAIAATALQLQIPFSVTLAAIALLYRLQPHLRNIERNVMRLIEMEAPLRRLGRMLDPSDKTYPPQGWARFEGLQEGIRLQDVCFTHPGATKPSLAGASFSIPRGQVTALVGPSGAGKTTIVNLLLRLYEPDRGLITVDGAPLSSLTRESWLKRIAVAGQDVELIESTVAENIGFVRPGASMEEICAAAEEAGVADVIRAMPDGFESWVGEGGTKLSGGQRQRIGLARALMARPDMLILDEAFSALDGGLEDEIRERLLARFRDGAVLLITHRMESALAADHVVCIDHGRIVEQGAPGELMVREHGAFSRLVRRKRLG